MNRIKHNIAILTLLVAAVILGSLQLEAQAPSLTVQARPQVVQGQHFTVTVRLSNVSANINRAPQLKNCTLLYGPAVSTMAYSSNINGRQENVEIVDFTFTYTADKAGTVTIPAISVNVGGKTLKSQPKTITILPPDKSTQQQQRGGHQGATAPSTGRRTQATANDLIVTTTLSKNSMYEHEAVIATIKVYTKFKILSFRPTTLPAFDGFLSEELPVSNNVQMEHFRGDNYYSAVLKRCLLFPQKEGKLVIKSGRYDVTLEAYEEVSNGFFITQRPYEQYITTTSNQITANVKALPKPQPAGFSGAVGTGFHATATLEPKTLRTNEAATYTYTVSGTGNVKYLTAPDIDFGPNVEAYDPETEDDAVFNGTALTGTYKAVYSIVPQQVGEITIPSCDFVYFNPTTGKYVTVPVAGFTRKVAKGSAVAAAAPQKAIGKQLDDILHIKSIKGSSLSKNPQPVFYSWPYLLCYIIIIVALVGAALIYRRYIRLNSDLTGRRSAKARGIAAKRLRKAKAEMNAHHEEAFYAAVASALWGYMGDKLRIPASALTRDNISERLASIGVSEQVIERTIAVLDDCEMARFTPGSADRKMSDLYDRALTVINDLEAKPRAAKQKTDDSQN